MSEIRLRGHDHVSVFVPELDPAIDWYRTHLGLALVDRWADDDSGMEWAHMSSGDVRVELIVRPGAAAVTTEGPPLGYHHLAVVVDDCTDAVRRLDEAGVRVVMGPTHFARHDTDWAFVTDHAGNVIELISYRRGSTWPPAAGSDGRDPSEPAPSRPGHGRDAFGSPSESHRSRADKESAP
jgi:catechol 2,3-dioxygenase-like lactoylglutathione lyase family enzyme